MLPKEKTGKRSKFVLSYWMEKGWFRYISLKQQSYREVKKYVKELYDDRERVMDIIIDTEIAIEDQVLESTIELQNQMKKYEEIYQAITIELEYIHEKYPFEELYEKGQRYRGFEVFCYEDDKLLEGYYCKVEYLDDEAEEEWATYLFIDSPIELNHLYHLADSLLNLQTNILDPAVEMTFLSFEEVETYSKKNISFIKTSKHDHA